MKTKNNQKLGYLAVSAAGALWGLNGFFIRQLNYAGVNDSYLISFFRFFFSIFLMGAIVLFTEGVKGFKVTRHTMLCCIYLGAVCHAAYNVFYALGCGTAGLSLTAIIVNTAPIFTLIFSRIVYGEKITGNKIVAIFINVIGCILCATNGKLDIKAISVIGIVFAIGGAITYSTSAVMGRYIKEKVSPYVTCFYCFLFASISLLPFSAKQMAGGVINGKVLLVGMLYSLIPSGISYILYYGGMRKVTESSKLPVLTSVEVVVAAVVAVTIFKEHMGVASVIGCCLVICSILLMNYRRAGKKD